MARSHSIAWAAGLFEGEGSIVYHPVKNRKNSLRVALSLTMSDEDVVEKFHTIVDTGSFLGPYKGQREGHKQRWVWQVTNFKGCYKVLKLLLPYLGARRGLKAQEMIREIEERIL